MKALSIQQPGGSRIVTGEKTIEVRGWKPDLADGEDLLIVETHRPLLEEGDTDLNGRVVAVVKVKAVRPFTTADMARACALVLAARKIYELDISLDEIFHRETQILRSA